MDGLSKDLALQMWLFGCILRWTTII